MASKIRSASGAITKFLLTTSSILLFSLFNLNVQAQELKELQLQQIDADPTQVMVFRDYPDHAAIVISSSLTGLRFESNVEIVDELSKPNEGEYILIVNPFRQIITANMDGFRQLRFTVPLTSPRQVLNYEISPQQEEVDLLPVVFSISPIGQNPTVYIDERAVDPTTAIRLEPGTHEVRIEKEGYKTITETITVSESSFQFSFELERLQPQTVTVSSTPTNARIELNNVERGVTDWQDFLLPGEYFVRISRVGYRSIQTTITVVENTNNDPNVNNFSFNLETFSAKINLDITPQNARVFLNRNPYPGQNTITVPPGPYLLEVEADGYIPYSENITLQETQVLDRTINLQQITGQMRLTVQPIQANISIQPVGGQIFEEWQGARILELPIGTYTVKATAPGYQYYTQNVGIRENQTTTVNIQMAEGSAQSSGQLSVRSQPATANISLLNASGVTIQQWTGSKLIDDLPTGTYTLRAIGTGYFDYTTTVQITEGETTVTDVQMRSISGTTPRTTTPSNNSGNSSGGSFFSYKKMSGLTLHYSTFVSDASTWEDQIDSQFGLGLGYFSYSKYKSFYFDFLYNSYTLASDTDYLNDEIKSYNISSSFVPTLPVGPFMFGLGLGADYTQYEAETDLEYQYYYTLDGFWNFTATLKPEKWGIGFLYEVRNSIDLGANDVYVPWVVSKFSLMFEF